MKHIYGFIDNPNLPYLKLPFEWNGTPINKKGKFVNHEHPHNESLKDLVKWMFMRNPQNKEKKRENWRLEIESKISFIKGQEDCIVWLGHASFFIRLNGITLLIDPVFFNVSLLKRKSDLPINPELFMDLDYILVSHDHRDHCDVKSLKLLSKNNPNTTYLTGLKLDNLIKKITKSNKIQAAGWYQQYSTEKIKISYVPSRHWGKRYFSDLNCNLWGGYVIQANEKTIYLAGDSGYGSHFLDIGKIFPEIDYCMIGIGAYKPDFMMEQSHLSPSQAVKAFVETNAKKMLPMHYGTFDLSNEPMSEPISELRKIEKKNYVRYLKPGEIEFLNE